MAKILDLKKILEEKDDNEAKQATRFLLDEVTEVLKKRARGLGNASKEEFMVCMMVACMLDNIFLMDSMGYAKERGQDYDREDAKWLIKSFLKETAELGGYYTHRLGLEPKDI